MKSTTAQQQIGEKLLPIMMLTLTISAMGALMFNFVLPTISQEFQLTIANVSWLSTSYGLIYAIGTVMYGKLSERFKLKSILTFGLIVFAMGSLIGLFSQSFWMALVGRCLQSLGAASIPATVMLIPIRYFSPEKRGKALGFVAVGLALGGALGPVVSALIVSIANWRWLFAVPLLILCTLPFYRNILKDEPKPEGNQEFDWSGAGLLAASVTLLLLSITNGNWMLLLGVLLTLCLFIVRIRTTKHPFIRPELFQNQRYTLGITISFLISGIVASLYFMGPMLLANVHHLPASWIGVTMVPAAIASALFGRKAGRLADQKGDTTLFFLASGLLFTAFVLLSTLIGTSPIWIAIFFIFGNVGQSCMMIALSNTVSKTVNQKEAGVGMGMLAMMNFLTQAISTGIYGKLIDLGATKQWNIGIIPSTGFIYSNIFLVLAILQIILLLLYYWQFGRKNEKQVQLTH